MKETDLQSYTLNDTQQAFRKKMLNPFMFKAFTFMKVPLGFIAGMKLIHLDNTSCQTTLPFKWLNINPFRSIYFAAQSMAAELSTASLGMMSIQGYKPSVAFIIVDMEAKFFKKATGKLTFTCTDGEKFFEAIDKCIETKEPVTVKAKTVGKMKDGTVVSEFQFTWSFKQRSK